MAGSKLDLSHWTLEELNARQDALYWRDEGEESYAIEDELAVRRGFLSADDELDHLSRNSTAVTGYSVEANDYYTLHSPEEAHAGVWAQPFGRHCKGGCDDCNSVSADSTKAHTRDPCVDRCTDDTNLCRICRHLDFEHLLTHLVPGHEITLGYLEDVAGRIDCAFCRLVTVSIKQCLARRPLPLHDPKERRTEVGLMTRSKDGDLAVWDMELVLHPRRHLDYDRILIQRSADTTAAIPFCGRPVNPRNIDFNIVRGWINACEHGVQGTGHESVNAEREDEFVPSRLIDVERYCIIRSTQGKYRYTALSYVWGGPQPVRLLLRNERRFMEPNSLLSIAHVLPRTIHDAIETTRRLGERYLWIDALCIVQDDLKFKQAELLLMDKIYARALLSIVAAHGDSVHAGLPGVSVVERDVKQHIEDVQGVVLVNRLPGVEAIVNRFVWNSRAWTYQERVLARRKLFITEQQVMFLCSHTEVELCEDVYGPAIRPSEQAWIDREHPNQYFRSVPGSLDHHIPAFCVNTAIYSSIVRQFCKRQITFSADIMNAFVGISNQLTDLFRGPFVLGLPVNELDSQLLWRPAGFIERRVCPDTGRKLFPSWSWAGWLGPCDGFVANARSSPAIELHDSTSDTWSTMDVVRGSETDDTWRLHDFYRCSFWQRRDETAFYYAHPIAGPGNRKQVSPTLLTNDTGSAENLPVRAESIKVNVTGATNPDADGYPALSALHDAESYQRALSLFTAGVILIGTAFVPLSVAGCLEPGTYDFIKIAVVATGPEFTDTIDELMGFGECYDFKIFGVWETGGQDRIDGLLVRTVDGISHRLGVAVCHAAAFEKANPERRVVLLG
ncbi:hypothetical protein LTR95_007716 [Oleoguttula sp. CCFEE 5521]